MTGIKFQHIPFGTCNHSVFCSIQDRYIRGLNFIVLLDSLNVHDNFHNARYIVRFKVLVVPSGNIDFSYLICFRMPFTYATAILIANSN